MSLYASHGSDSIAVECVSKPFDVVLRNGVTDSRVSTDQGALLFQIDTGSTKIFARPGALPAANRPPSGPQPTM